MGTCFEFGGQSKQHLAGPKRSECASGKAGQGGVEEKRGWG